MQPKQCYVNYIDGVPISVHDVKLFTTKDEYNAFIKTCEINKQKLLDKHEKEKKLYKDRLDLLDKKNKKLENLVGYLIYELLIDRGEIKPIEKDNLPQFLKGGELTDLPEELILILKEVAK